MVVARSASADLVAIQPERTGSQGRPVRAERSESRSGALDGRGVEAMSGASSPRPRKASRGWARVRRAAAFSEESEGVVGYLVTRESDRALQGPALSPAEKGLLSTTPQRMASEAWERPRAAAAVARDQSPDRGRSVELIVDQQPFRVR